MALTPREKAALASSTGDGDDPAPPPGSRLVLRMRIAFHDVDMLRHVNSVAFARWAEVLRDRYQVELLHEDVKGRQAFVVRTIEMEYLAPAEHGEWILAVIEPGDVGRRSFAFHYRFVRVADGDLLARGSSVMIAYDVEAGAAIEVPAAWREVFADDVTVVVGENPGPEATLDTGPVARDADVVS